jgi:hypothetical protein
MKIDLKNIIKEEDLDSLAELKETGVSKSLMFKRWQRTLDEEIESQEKQELNHFNAFWDRTSEYFKNVTLVLLVLSILFLIGQGLSYLTWKPYNERIKAGYIDLDAPIVEKQLLNSPKGVTLVSASTSQTYIELNKTNVLMSFSVNLPKLKDDNTYALTYTLTRNDTSIANTTFYTKPKEFGVLTFKENHKVNTLWSTPTYWFKLSVKEVDSTNVSTELEGIVNELQNKK